GSILISRILQHPPAREVDPELSQAGRRRDATSVEVDVQPFAAVAVLVVASGGAPDERHVVPAIMLAVEQEMGERTRRQERVDLEDVIVAGEQAEDLRDQDVEPGRVIVVALGGLPATGLAVVELPGPGLLELLVAILGLREREEQLPQLLAGQGRAPIRGLLPVGAE